MDICVTALVRYGLCNMQRLRGRRSASTRPRVASTSFPPYKDDTPLDDTLPPDQYYPCGMDLWKLTECNVKWYLFRRGGVCCTPPPP